MEIIVVGTHEYEWALKIFARQFNKHWGKSPVTYWGDRPSTVELPPNFSYARVPAYVEGSWPWDHWYGNGLRSILEVIPDEQVILFLPDHWLYAHVNKHAVRNLAAYMRENLDVVRGNLTANICLSVYGKVVQVREGWRIVQVHPNDSNCGLFGGTAGAPALWNRAALLEVLEPGWSFHGTENLGTEKMVREWPRWRSVGVEAGPVRRAHGLSHHEPNIASFEGMDQEDMATCAAMLPEGWTWRG